MIESLVQSGPHLHMHQHSARPTGLGQVPTGLMQGQSVQQLDHASVLADAADELTQQFSSKIEEKTLRERRLGTAGKLPLLQREQIHALLQQFQEAAHNDEQRQQDLLALGRRILRNPSQTRQELARHGGQATAQYLSLLEVAELLKEGALGPDVGHRALDAVQEAAADIESEHGDAVWADINTVQAAQDHEARAKEAGAAHSFRQTYRDAVLGAADLSSTLRHLLQAHKERPSAAFTQVLNDMVKAIGQDLTAARPSRDPVRLQALVSDLYHLEVIATVIDACSALGQGLNTAYGIPLLQASALTSDLAGLSSERWVDATRFDHLARQHQCDANASCQVAFMKGVRQAFTQLPLQIFSSPESRQSILDAAQLALDRAIDLEEEEN
jgi:type III secretion protein W